jgi:tetratricopeptide (TPR) repeat protein
MRILKSKAMRIIVITILILIALGLLVRALPIWPSLWAWAIAHPAESSIILGVLALLATVISIIVNIWYGRYQRRQWELEKERDVKEKISERPNFPFEAVTPEQLPGKFPTLPLADQVIGYLHRLPPEEQEAMQRLLDNATRLLIYGRTGLGKTREAIASVQRLAAHKREPITVLLPKPPLTLPPFTWPPDLPTRTIVLLLDRVEENWGFAAREGRKRMEALAAGDLRGWLPQAVAHLEERFRGSDFRVIATVRDDPIELWERIEPCNPFWRDFTVYRLPDWEESRREELCKRTADWQEIGEVEEEARQLIVQKCDGTPASIITFLKGYRGAERLSLDDAREFDGRYPNDWERIWREKIAPYPAARHLFAALSILNQAKVTPYKYLAVRLAARLWDERFAWQREPEVEGRYGLKWVESWVAEEDGILKCPEAYLEGKGDLGANATLLTDVLIAASRKRGHAAELVDSLLAFSYTLGAELADYGNVLRVCDRAIEILSPLREVEEIKPYLAGAFNNRGLAYADKAELVEERDERLSLLELAIADYSEAIGIKPDDEAAFNNRGNAYADKSELVEEREERLSLLELAIADYSEAIGIKPDDEAAFYNRGLAYVKKAELVEERKERLSLLELAIADYSKAIGIKPDDEAAFYNRGNAYVKKAELVEERKERLSLLELAIADWSKAIGIKHDYEAAFYNRGNAYVKKAELVEERKERLSLLELAIADWSKAIGIKPDDEAAFYNRGNAYVKKAELVEERKERLSLLELAIADWSKAIGIKHDYEAAFNNRGNAYADKAKLVEERDERLSLLELAIADYSEAIGIKPDDEKAFNNRGLAYADKSELVEEREERLSLLELAIADYSEAIGIKPDDEEAFYNRGLAYADKAKLVEERDERLSLLELAIADYSEAIGIKHDYEKAFYNRGLAYADKAELVEEREEKFSLLELAIADWSKAIELTEDAEVKAMCLRNRAEAFIELEKLEEAEEDLERARGLDPEHPYLFARYGQLHLWREEFDRAVAMCREAQERTLKEAWVQFNLALAALCQGLEEAREEYRRGMEMADEDALRGAIEDLAKILTKRPGLEGAEEIMEMLREARNEYTSSPNGHDG